ncbi:MAG: hypothetical protein GVY36_15890 [Verrucomicrobia bacterium]|jgi:hypothetical protein|nr:hypothetical protein [Verrucomicrobiota bacterium]
MVALNENFIPGKPALGPKNRVGNFFGGVGDRAGGNRPVTRNRIGENRPTLTIIASGRPVWPSKDPIGEQGGLNLYGFIGNDAVNYWDVLGLSAFTYGVEQFGGGCNGWRKAYQDALKRIDSLEIQLAVLQPIYNSITGSPGEYGVIASRESARVITKNVIEGLGLLKLPKYADLSFEIALDVNKAERLVEDRTSYDLAFELASTGALDLLKRKAKEAGGGVFVKGANVGGLLFELAIQDALAIYRDHVETKALGYDLEWTNRYNNAVHGHDKSVRDAVRAYWFLKENDCCIE